MTQPKQARSARRRDDIVACAWAMFAADGYHASSVNAIVARLGISKGSFYHHFESKEAVLNAGVENVIRASLDEQEARVAQSAPGVIARIAGLLQAGHEVSAGELRLYAELIQVMLTPANAIVRDKLLDTEQRLVQPLLADIIRSGVSEGVFNVTDAELAAEFVFGALAASSLATLRRVLAGELSAADVSARVTCLVEGVERLLGARPASLATAVDTTMLVALFEAVAPAPHPTYTTHDEGVLR